MGQYGTHCFKFPPWCLTLDSNVRLGSSWLVNFCEYHQGGGQRRGQVPSLFYLRGTNNVLYLPPHFLTLIKKKINKPSFTCCIIRETLGKKWWDTPIFVSLGLKSANLPPPCFSGENCAQGFSEGLKLKFHAKNLLSKSCTAGETVSQSSDCATERKNSPWPFHFRIKKKEFMSFSLISPITLSIAQSKVLH